VCLFESYLKKLMPQWLPLIQNTRYLSDSSILNWPQKHLRPAQMQFIHATPDLNSFQCCFMLTAEAFNGLNTKPIVIQWHMCAYQYKAKVVYLCVRWALLVQYIFVPQFFTTNQLTRSSNLTEYLFHSVTTSSNIHQMMNINKSLLLLFLFIIGII